MLRPCFQHVMFKRFRERSWVPGLGSCRLADSRQGLLPSDVDVQVRQVGRENGRPPLRIFSSPSSPVHSPLVLFFHGGGLLVAASPAVDGFCRDGARSGKVCVQVNYSLSPVSSELLVLPVFCAILFAACGFAFPSVIAAAVSLAMVPLVFWRRAVHPLQFG